jgi:hypothetical protein
MWNNLGTAYEHLDLLDDARAAFDHGGARGSREALASRKRLEGVKTIVVMKTEPATRPGGAAASSGYDLAEPMPPAPAPGDAAAGDAGDAPDGDAAVDPAQAAEPEAPNQPEAPNKSEAPKPPVDL